MRRIHAVSQGEYSDYQVLAVCEDKATAEAWVQAIRDDPDRLSYSIRLEEIWLLDPGEPPQKVTHFYQSVNLWDDGTAEPLQTGAWTDWVIDSCHHLPFQRPYVRYVRAPIHDGKGGRLEVRAMTAEECGKVVSEKIAMWKAGAWGGRQCQEVIEE